MKNTKKILWLLAIFIMIIGACLTISCDTLKGEDEINITLINETGYTITQAYIRPSSSNDWGNHINFTWLENSESISPSGDLISISIAKIVLDSSNFPTGRYDIQMLAHIGSSNVVPYTQTNVMLEMGKNKALTFTQNDVVGIVVSPSLVNVSRGGNQTFTVVYRDTGISPQSVAWSVSGNNSTSTTINSSGLLTVASDETSATLTVRAALSMSGFTNISGAAAVNVPAPTVTSVVVSPSSATVIRGDTQTFTAVVNGTGYPSQSVTWSVSGNNSSSTTTNSSGLLSVASDETAPSLTVSATSTVSGFTNISGTVTVNITIGVGNIIPFGSYQWRVLDIDTRNNRALIITQNIIERRQYNNNSSANNSNAWANCDLRAYLNGTFYNSFSAADRARIVNVNNPNSTGGNTWDRIFLLSYAEAQSYFSSYADRIATWDGSASWWWLRTSGTYIGDTHYVYYVDSNGSIHIHHSVLFTGGVRPALWLDL